MGATGFVAAGPDVAPSDPPCPCRADRLANNVSRGVLEEVRQVKQQLGKLMARVERLKQELVRGKGGEGWGDYCREGGSR